jgi:hypothetical protein
MSRLIPLKGLNFMDKKPYSMLGGVRTREIRLSRLYTANQHDIETPAHSHVET